MATSRICSIPGCGKPHMARGLCMPHYQSRRRSGMPFDVDTHHGEAPRFYRDVVLPYEGDKCLIWPFGRDRIGYGRLKIDLKTRTISRVLCELVHGPAPTKAHQAAHSCGKGHLGCVNRRHVSWKTPVENNADKFIHKTQPLGEKHLLAKLTEAKVWQIRAMMGTKTQLQIAREFGVSPQLISDINVGRRWGWLVKP